jgi:hypothetical protein
MYVNITILNLFKKSKTKYKKYISFYKPISENKNVELEAFYSNYEIFKFELNSHLIGRDHAGFDLSINILGFEVSFRFYDSRHWDYGNWRWEEK